MDCNDLSPFWFITDFKFQIKKCSDFYQNYNILNRSLFEVFEFSLANLNNDEISLNNIKNKIFFLTQKGHEYRLRTTILETSKEIVFIPWPAINNLTQAKQLHLQDHLNHPACTLADILIVKDVLTKSKDSNIKLENEKMADKMQMQKLQEISELKSALLANMSHEIRTPMNGILGMIEMLQLSNIDPKQAEMLDIAASSGQMLLTIINDILDLSKLESKEFVLTESTFNLDKVAYECLELVKIKNTSTEVKISYINNLRNNSFFISDQTRIRQIILNLLSNAIKFTIKGEVLLTLSSEEINSDKENIKITVKDSGIGISKDFQKKIFDNFTQEEQGATRQYGGTGLGLSITKALVEKLSGKIFLHSKINEGTTFEVELPLQITNQEVTNTKPNLVDFKQSSFINKKILVAEDNKFNQILIKQIFNKLGLSFDFAHDGSEVIKKFESGCQYDLIFMDLRMPKLSGIETTNILFDKFQSQLPPIIALTANAFDDDKQKCLNAGMRDLVPKPINIKMIQDICKKYL